VDAAVDVTFGGEIDDGTGLMFGEQASYQGGITDVALHENMAAIPI